MKKALCSLFLLSILQADTLLDKQMLDVRKILSDKKNTSADSMQTFLKDSTNAKNLKEDVLNKELDILLQSTIYSAKNNDYSNIKIKYKEQEINKYKVRAVCSDSTFLYGDKINKTKNYNYKAKLSSRDWKNKCITSFLGTQYCPRNYSEYKDTFMKIKYEFEDFCKNSLFGQYKDNGSTVDREWRFGEHRDYLIDYIILNLQCTATSYIYPSQQLYINDNDELSLRDAIFSKKQIKIVSEVDSNGNPKKTENIEIEDKNVLTEASCMSLGDKALKSAEYYKEQHYLNNALNSNLLGNMHKFHTVLHTEENNFTTTLFYDKEQNNKLNKKLAKIDLNANNINSIKSQETSYKKDNILDEKLIDNIYNTNSTAITNDKNFKKDLKVIKKAKEFDNEIVKETNFNEEKATFNANNTVYDVSAYITKETPAKYCYVKSTGTDLTFHLNHRGKEYTNTENTDREEKQSKYEYQVRECKTKLVENTLKYYCPKANNDLEEEDKDQILYDISAPANNSELVHIVNEGVGEANACFDKQDTQTLGKIAAINAYIKQLKENEEFQKNISTAQKFPNDPLQFRFDENDPKIKLFKGSLTDITDDFNRIQGAWCGLGWDHGNGSLCCSSDEATDKLNNKIESTIFKYRFTSNFAESIKDFNTAEKTQHLCEVFAKQIKADLKISCSEYVKRYNAYYTLKYLTSADGISKCNLTYLLPEVINDGANVTADQNDPLKEAFRKLNVDTLSVSGTLAEITKKLTLGIFKPYNFGISIFNKNTCLTPEAIQFAKKIYDGAGYYPVRNYNEPKHCYIAPANASLVATYGITPLQIFTTVEAGRKGYSIFSTNTNQHQYNLSYEEKLKRLCFLSNKNECIKNNTYYIVDKDARSMLNGKLANQVTKFFPEVAGEMALWIGISSGLCWDPTTIKQSSVGLFSSSEVKSIIDRAYSKKAEWDNKHCSKLNLFCKARRPVCRKLYSSIVNAHERWKNKLGHFRDTVHHEFCTNKDLITHAIQTAAIEQKIINEKDACNGLTIAQFNKLDKDKIDFSAFNSLIGATTQDKLDEYKQNNTSEKIKQQATQQVLKK